MDRIESCTFEQVSAALAKRRPVYWLICGEVKRLQGPRAVPERLENNRWLEDLTEKYPL